MTEPLKGKGVVGRMAPTPSSYLHIGNILACLVAWLSARRQGGRIVLRIEDLDVARCKREYIDAILHDLETLGLFWDNETVIYQGTRSTRYDEAFEALKAQNAVYPCYCSRADLHAASAPHRGERYIYAGTCRNLSPSEREAAQKSRPAAYRVIVPDAVYRIEDALQGPYTQNLATDCGDFIVKRSDGVYAYQLAVVVDDLEQGVNEVIRGIDLLDSAPQQVYLRGLLEPQAPEVSYAHIPLLLDEQGRRLSKRDRDMGLPTILGHFRSVEHLVGYLASIAGLTPDDTPISTAELVGYCSFDGLRERESITWRLPG